MSSLSEETLATVQAFDIGCCLFVLDQGDSVSQAGSTGASASASSSSSSSSSSASSASASAAAFATPISGYGSKLTMVVWRGRGVYLNVLCDKNHLHILRERLTDMGVELPSAEAAAALRPQTKTDEERSAEGVAVNPLGKGF